jgi:NAD(P)-dependent dehydrogenase (short-subunit alcohol dehydrogenase family)
MAGMLHGKVAVITGAGSGIGRASAIAMASHGAKVVVSDINEEAAAETAATIDDAHRGAAIWVRSDVTKLSDAESLVARAAGEFGKVDVVHANAGVGQVGGAAGDTTEEEWRRVVEVNVNGVFNTFKAAVPALLASGNASVINTASGAGVVGVQGQAAYVASKHAVVGFTKAAALDYAGRGIRVNAIAPGLTRTSMLEGVEPDLLEALVAATPIGRIADPVEIANVAVWLASDMSSFVVGATIVTDGGHSVA